MGDNGAVEQTARKDLKRQRRQESAAIRLQAERALRRRQQLMWGGSAALIVLGLAALVFWLTRPDGGVGASGSVQTVPIQGQAHIQRGASHPPYNSKPPTSGWHYGDAVAPAGVSANPIPNEVQVHNLEHGEIMVQYDCPEGCQDMITQLEGIVRSYRSKVILAPYPGLDRRIALTAWGKIAFLDAVDEPFIRRFIAENKDKAPEVFPD